MMTVLKYLAIVTASVALTGCGFHWKDARIPYGAQDPITMEYAQAVEVGVYRSANLEGPNIVIPITQEVTYNTDGTTTLGPPEFGQVVMGTGALPALAQAGAMVAAADVFGGDIRPDTTTVVQEGGGAKAGAASGAQSDASSKSSSRSKSYSDARSKATQKQGQKQGQLQKVYGKGYGRGGGD